MSLWQKPDAERTDSGETTTVPPVTEQPKSFEPRSKGFVNIGRSICIKGELSGNEDLTIDGTVEGRINLKDHNLVIGEHGRIKAELHAKSVVVNGEVVGNVTADDKVELSPSGSVQGDLCAPRVALADGSSFKGSIDMSGSRSVSSSGSATVTKHAALPQAAKA